MVYGDTHIAICVCAYLLLLCQPHYSRVQVVVLRNLLHLPEGLALLLHLVAQTSMLLGTEDGAGLWVIRKVWKHMHITILISIPIPISMPIHIPKLIPIPPFPFPYTIPHTHTNLNSISNFFAVCAIFLNSVPRLPLSPPSPGMAPVNVEREVSMFTMSGMRGLGAGPKWLRSCIYMCICMCMIYLFVCMCLLYRLSISDVYMYMCMCHARYVTHLFAFKVSFFRTLLHLMIHHHHTAPIAILA
ncbi:hypothetical protein EON63_23715 [archaeon]|nr:MAG: hypothetical protein EON63_23715 [archaeon]